MQTFGTQVSEKMVSGKAHADVPRNAQTATTSSHHPMARLSRLKLMKHLFRGCDNLKNFFSKISLPCPTAVFLTTILHCLGEPMSRLMLAEGGEVAASRFFTCAAFHFDCCGWSSRRCCPAYTFNLTSSLCSQVKKKRKRNGSFPQVQFPRAALSDQSFSRSIIPLSAFNKQG